MCGKDGGNGRMITPTVTVICPILGCHKQGMHTIEEECQLLWTEKWFLSHGTRCVFVHFQAGKTKFTVENCTKTRIVIADTRIHILGSFKNIRTARYVIQKAGHVPALFHSLCCFIFHACDLVENSFVHCIGMQSVS